MLPPAPHDRPLDSLPSSRPRTCQAGVLGVASRRNQIIRGPLTHAQASIWLLETILTSTLIFTVFCATDAERGQTAAHIPVRESPSPGHYLHLLYEAHTACLLPTRLTLSWARAQVLAPFAIGFAVFIAHLCAIPLDGEASSVSPQLHASRSHRLPARVAAGSRMRQ